MSKERGSRRFWVRRALASAMAGMLFLTLPANAGTKSDTQYRYYDVGGTTEAAIVSYMRRHPYAGDNGNAYANIHHTNKLSLETQQEKGICRVRSVDLAIDFTITLPRASQPSALSGRARTSWNSFVAFAKRHEEHHRASFVECGRAFVAKAGRQTGAQCFALELNVRSMLREADRNCEAKQRAFDRQQSNAVKGLSLFVRGGRR